MPALRDPIGLVRHVVAIGDLPLLELIVERLSPGASADPATRALMILMRELELAPLHADEGRDA